MDKITQEQRHYNMSRIHGKDTKPEIAVRQYLFKRGLRYRKNDKKLPGHPDIVLPKYKTVIFVNGCFWHGHEDCKFSKIPETNIAFWRDKIIANQTRDKRVSLELSRMGWRVLTVWQCELRKALIAETLDKLYSAIVTSV